MFKVNEIKSWAKGRGITLKKKDDGYVWFEGESEESEPCSLDDSVLAIYNRITDGKYIEHQANFRRGNA
jgi:hypothetical protein